ncbi:MAG: fibro-slime domain-containing protein [Eubacteriales bacterium]
MKKRFCAILMTAATLFAALPTVSLPARAATVYSDSDAEYVSLPVTIRDYAGDGMLFEWNELGNTGDQTIGGSTVLPIVKHTTQAGGGAYTATAGDGYVRYTSTSTGIYITYTISGGYTRTQMRYAVVKYRTNGGYTSQPTIGHRWNNGGNNNYVNFPTDGYNQPEFKTVIKDLGEGSDTVSHVTIYPRLASGNYIDIAEIAFFSSLSDANSYASGTVTGGDVYHHGSTRGYGLLQTVAADHFNDLTDSAAISGTTLTENGTWNSAEVTTSTTTLNSGALQTLYGCYVRTDLVEPKLGANGKPVYTEAAVAYLANYMAKTLPVAWQNVDGTYNMWYVMGTKLFNDSNVFVGTGGTATRDLATVLRSIITGGLGSYAETKAKTLSQVTDCTTYFDAAYFLLHNTFTDNPGYGVTVPEYRTVNLVKKTVDGKSYYVYNSAFDGTVYDTTNGVIYNSQTDTITTREGTTYVRGNLQPESRFDPIGALGSGAYYGLNGNPYVSIVGNASVLNYYNKTNYNLTLEGHAQFIFYEDDDLYFNFTGDDDVYLYINGVRVLDMGGAHAISKCGISLNSVKDLCGLKDGEVYDFDFFYMERHGTAANFGLETNIKIVDPSMLTKKNAYQKGTNVGNFGYVDPSIPVSYGFALTNNGEAKIEELTFRDNDIGVYLTKDAIALNSETNILQLSARVTDKDGKEKVSYAAGNLTEDILKQLLLAGLEIGDTIEIAGFQYTIPTAAWTDEKFTNTVYTTAISYGNNASHRTLNGLASCTVQQQEYSFEHLHFYEWVGKGVTVTKDELIAAVIQAGVANPGTTVQLCSPSGNTSDAGINPRAAYTEGGGIKYTGVVTGADTYYYKVGIYGPVAVTIYSYDVADNVYVLDYGLPVELNGQDFGLLVNDTLTLIDNPYATTASTVGITSSTTNYGMFSWNAPSLKYTLTNFMNGEDNALVTVQVLENGATELTKATGVLMEETVRVIPANVVYYEDDFAGITYIGTDKNGWVQYRSEDSYGNEQSADQDSSYGSDPNYAADKKTTYTTLTLDTSNLNTFQTDAINYLNSYLGLIEGDASNGTLSGLVVKETEDVLSFEFCGTGFEIVSRTTQYDYAVVSVKVERRNADGTYTVVRQFPVITESKGGDLYQVPIISVTGLERSAYRVTLSAFGSTATKTRVLYIDGVRIYEPIQGLDEVRYYNADEQNAVFLEVKSLIQNGQAIYADISDTDGGTILGSGTTVIETTDDSGLVLRKATSVDEYMTFGPNNELYLNGFFTTPVLALYLYPDSTVPESARTVEIGAHRKADSLFYDNSPATLVYGSTAADILEMTHVYTVSSGTEQYYELNVENLVQDEKNRYLLLVGTNEKEASSLKSLALTNLKVSGYSVRLVEPETADAAAANDLAASPAVAAVMSLRSLRAASMPKPEEPVVPVNENLTVTSAALMADNVVSGKFAIAAVKAGADAVKLTVVDAAGNEVELARSASTTKDGVVTFQAMWKVTGSRGDVLRFTVRVYDADGLASVNTMDVTVTIK